MDEEAQVEEVVEEAVEAEEITVESVADEFNILTEQDEEPVEQEAVADEPVAAEEKPDGGWSAKVRKDKELRTREIALKQKEESLQGAESKLAMLSNFREEFVKSPEKILKDLGVDPLEFFEDWTRRLANDTDEISPELRMSGQEKRLQELEGELRKRDEVDQKRNEDSRRQQAIGAYHAEIKSFLDKTDSFPLTKSECTVEDIAKGIAIHYREHGVELKFQEACEKIEAGLMEEEDSLLGNERLVERIKERYGLVATNQGKAAKTLSGRMTTHPTRKTSGRHPTIEEVMEEYGDRIFV